MTREQVPFQYINDGHHLHCSHSTIELRSEPPSPDDLIHFNSSTRPDLIRYINYSPPFQAPLFTNHPKSFYASLAKFSALIEDENAKFQYLLREGDAVIFDNRRVLHARTAFQEKDEKAESVTVKEGEACRWLKGCYLQEDAFLDKARMAFASVSEPLDL